MPPNTLPGFFFTTVAETSPRHFVGGENRFAGASCPNCETPFSLYLTVDTSDARLGLESVEPNRIPLLYCNRCSVLNDDIVYRVNPDSSVELLKYEVGRDEDHEEEWDDVFGSSVLPRVVVSLAPITDRIQTLLDILCRWYPAPDEKITEDEQDELRSLLSDYKCPAIARGHFDVLNQVGGRPFLNQGLSFPKCPTCKNDGIEGCEMVFLANVQNDERLGIHVSLLGGNYFTFFLCPRCCIIHAEQRM